MQNMQPAAAPWNRPEVKPTTAQAPSPEQRIEYARREIAEAEAQIQAEAERAQLKIRLRQEVALATATRAMLLEIVDVLLNGAEPGMRNYLAEFQRELAPLARTYGFKIKAVGNKDVAVLTKV